MGLRTLSPAGAPISLRALLNGLKAEFGHHKETTVFQAQLKTVLSANSVFLVSSGKVALSLILKSLMTISRRREVIIPAYSSFCLASAVASAGLSVKLCDIDTNTLDFNLDQLSKLVDTNTLAVIPVHLFGLVSNLDEILSITMSKKAFIVEDGAQAIGARFRNRYVGTIGDAGIFSLGRGKSISTVIGGIVNVQREDLADILEKKIAQLPNMNQLCKLKIFLSAVAIYFLLNPMLYGIPDSLPFLKLGINEYDPDFKFLSFSNLQAGIGRIGLENLTHYNRKRIKNAYYLIQSLKRQSNVKLPKIISDSSPCFTRFPIFFKSSKLREQFFTIFSSLRLGVSKNFPCPLNKIPGFKHLIVNSNDSFPGAEWVCRRILTLPTHPFVNKNDLSKIVRILTA